jgi:ferredoxin-NADP reductase
VAHYETRLAVRQLRTDDIMVFSLEKPRQYEFRAGQFCFLNLPDIGFQDERGLRRHLSIASSPLEKELLFATKVSRSAFKQTLKEMNLGDIITIESPLGTFLLPEDTSNPLVFLAGGIGITPFRSMMRYILDAHTSHIVTLFYSNRTPQEATFIDEFQSMADTHGHISFVPTMTRIESTSTLWSGLTGRLTASMIREGCKEWRDAIYFIAGPPKMSESMKALLAEMDIQQHRVHVERFTGY